MKRFTIPFILVAALFLLTAAAVRRPVWTSAAETMIIQGTSTSATDGTVTNTFSTAFSAAPTVVISPYGSAVLSTTNHVVVTTSNFIWTCSLPSKTANWVAIGAR